MAQGVYIDTIKLKAAIGHGNAKRLADLMGMHPHSLSRKLNAGISISIEDLNEICYHLDLNAGDYLDFRLVPWSRGSDLCLPKAPLLWIGPRIRDFWGAIRELSVDMPPLRVTPLSHPNRKRPKTATCNHATDVESVAPLAMGCPWIVRVDSLCTPKRIRQPEKNDIENSHLLKKGLL